MYSNTCRFFRQPLRVSWTLSSPQISSRVRVSWSDQGIFLLRSDRRWLVDGCSSKRRNKQPRYCEFYTISAQEQWVVGQMCANDDWTNGFYYVTLHNSGSLSIKGCMVASEAVLSTSVYAESSPSTGARRWKYRNTAGRPPLLQNINHR